MFHLLFSLRSPQKTQITVTSGQQQLKRVNSLNNAKDIKFRKKTPHTLLDIKGRKINTWPLFHLQMEIDY